jgi:hypothetical protein
MSFISGFSCTYIRNFDHIFPPFPTHLSPSPHPTPLPKWSSFYVLVYFLDSKYERKHAIFHFLSLPYFTEHGNLQFHSFSSQWHDFFLHHGWTLLGTGILILCNTFPITFLCSDLPQLLFKYGLTSSLYWIQHLVQYGNFEDASIVT